MYATNIMHVRFKGRRVWLFKDVRFHFATEIIKMSLLKK